MNRPGAQRGLPSVFITTIPAVIRVLNRTSQLAFRLDIHCRGALQYTEGLLI